jgi:hypothetical protein
VQVGGNLITGEDLTYKFVFPLPSSPAMNDLSDDVLHSWRLILIEGGTSLKARKRLPAMMGIYSGAGFPDWMVWDDQVKLDGMAGVLAMGFFDLDWQVDPDLSYFNEELIAKRAAGR